MNTLRSRRITNGRHCGASGPAEHRRHNSESLVVFFLSSLVRFWCKGGSLWPAAYSLLSTPTYFLFFLLLNVMLQGVPLHSAGRAVSRYLSDDDGGGVRVCVCVRVCLCATLNRPVCVALCLQSGSVPAQ